MHRMKCPFRDKFNHVVKCPYMINYKMCADIEGVPGNKDAWCGQKIRDAIDSEMREKPAIIMRQNYSCNICGLKSFVTHTTKEDTFDIIQKIDVDHRKREPKCLCPLDDLNMVGKPIQI